ncbi:MAG: hypothetical protein AAF740_06005 [Bacteroidota bacterium]
MQKFRKEKEKIRDQIIKSLEVYKGKDGFTFAPFSSPTNVKLCDNDTEVLLMKLNEDNWLLLTTKYLFVKQDGTIYNIDGDKITSFKFLNLKHRRNKEKMAEFDSRGEFKSWLYSGDFEITVESGVSVIVNLPYHNFGFCLFNAMKKLRFVTSRYEGF